MMGCFQHKSEVLLKMILVVAEDQDHRYGLDVFVDVLKTGLCVLMMTYTQDVILDIGDAQVSLVGLREKFKNISFIK